MLLDERRKFNAVGRARGDIVKPDVAVDMVAKEGRELELPGKSGEKKKSIAHVMPGQDWRWEYEYSERRKFGTIYIMVLVKRPLSWREGQGEYAVNEVNRYYNKVALQG